MEITSFTSLTFCVVFYLLILCCDAKYSPLHRPAIPTDICSITSQSELIELQSDVYYERIACEADRYVGPNCARYWVSYNKYIRKKLSFDQCTLQQRDLFHNWMGTRTVNGEFQNDFVATLSLENSYFRSLSSLLQTLHDDTLTLLLSGTNTTLDQLFTLVNINSKSERQNTFEEEAILRTLIHFNETALRTFIQDSGNAERQLNSNETFSTLETVKLEGLNTRTNASNEFQNIRNISSNEFLATRTKISNEEQATRTRDSNEETSTRDFDILQETTTRNLVQKEESATRTLVSLREQQNRNLTFSEENSTRTTVQREETRTREVDIAQEVATRDNNEFREEINRNTTIQESQTIQQLDVHEEEDTRNLTSSLEQSTRELDVSQEESLRQLEKQNHDSLRAQISEENAQIQSEEDAQHVETIGKWHSEKESAQQTLVATSESNKINAESVARAEEYSSRVLVETSERQSISDTKDQHQTTRSTLVEAHIASSASTEANVNAAANNTDATVNTTTEKVQTAWNGAANAVLASILKFKNEIPSPLFNELATHFNLINSNRKGYPVVDLYSREAKLNEVRTLVNSTMAYNLLKYGESTNSRAAASSFRSGDIYRNAANPDYRLAAIKYSEAYYYAVTPNNNWWD